MRGAVSLSVLGGLTLAAGLTVICLVLARPVQRFAGRRSARAFQIVAREAGARWAGSAFMGGRPNAGAHPAVSHALRNIGAGYGESLGPIKARAVPGTIILRETVVEWLPGHYNGRGEADPWMLPLDQITGIELTRWPTRTAAALATAEGVAEIEIMDPDGFTKSFVTATGLTVRERRVR